MWVRVPPSALKSGFASECAGPFAAPRAFAGAKRCLRADAGRLGPGSPGVLTDPVVLSFSSRVEKFFCGAKFCGTFSTACPSHARNRFRHLSVRGLICVRMGYFARLTASEMERRSDGPLGQSSSPAGHGSLSVRFRRFCGSRGWQRRAGMKSTGNVPRVAETGRRGAT